MFRTILTISIVCAAALGCGLAATATGGADDAAALDRPAKLRVGVYDNRAIAIAYGNSDFNDVGEKMREYGKAKDAGDKERVKELEEWGPRHQRQLHRQAFGRVPVTELLEHVKDRFGEVAERTGVDVIAFECNYLGPNVEKIDITHELVMLYNPTERALGWIEGLKDVEPIDLDEIEQNHDH